MTDQSSSLASYAHTRFWEAFGVPNRREGNDARWSLQVSGRGHQINVLLKIDPDRLAVWMFNPYTKEPECSIYERALDSEAAVDQAIRHIESCIDGAGVKRSVLKPPVPSDAADVVVRNSGTLRLA